jgi:small subunit ribosomal protein S17
MPKALAVGIVTGDKNDKTRRVEIPRLVRHEKYGKFLRKKTICYVHDEENESRHGDRVEIEESVPTSKTKRWRLVRVVTKSTEIDLAALRAARKAQEQESAADEAAKAEAAGAPSDAAKAEG